MTARIVQITAGLGCTCFFLALALSHVPKDAIGASLATADPTWLGAAMLVYAAALSLRAWRWQIILRPVAATPYLEVAPALVVGYGLNAILPLRLGELFRAEFLKTSVGLDRVSALTSIVVERLFDGLTVVACLAVGLFLGAGTRQNAGILIDVLATGSAIVGLILLLGLCFAGPLMSRVLVWLPGLSAQVTMVQRGFEVLRTRRTAKVVALTLLIYLPDALALWSVVKAMGLGLDFAETLALLGVASLSTIVPSGPAFIGTLQFAYALAIEFAGAPAAIGIASATLVQVCILLPTALAAIAILIHRSCGVHCGVLAKREPKLTPVGP